MTLKNSAFTLIELTLVSVIILALVALSIPLFRNTFADLSAKDAAFNISKLANYAQEKAVIDKNNYSIIFDFNRRQYQLFELKRSAEKLSYVPAKGRFGRAFSLPPELCFYDPANDITHKEGEEYKRQAVFYPDGSSDALSVDIIDKQGNGYSLALKGFGSPIQIKEVSRER